MFKTVRDVKKGEEYMVGYSSVEENLNTYGIRCKWRPLQDLEPSALVLMAAQH